MITMTAKCTMRGITDKFAELGKPEHVGHAFAIARYALDHEVKDMEKFILGLPRPDYEHGIWHDTATDNLIVLRASKDGSYALDEFTSAGSKRLR